MSGAGVEELYKNYGILADAGDKVSEVRVSFVPPPTFTMVPPLPQHADAFEGIIKATKGSLNEKKLASGFITKFFRYFSSLQESAIDALLDLIEDEDAQVYHFFTLNRWILRIPRSLIYLCYLSHKPYAHSCVCV